MVKGAADNGEIAFAERKEAVLNMTVGGAGTEKQNLEVSVAVHSHAVPAIFGEE